MSFFKKLFPTKPVDKGCYTIEKISGWLYVHSLLSAHETANEIIETMKIKNDDEIEKLKFDLGIAFIAAASYSIYGHYKLSKESQTKIIDKVCNSYREGIYRQQNKDPQKSNVDGEFFVRDAEERNFCINELQRILGHDIDKLPWMSLYGLASLLFNRRFLEYQMLFKQDEERILTHGKSSRSGALLKFLSGGETVALIPGRVYEHWSGKKSHTLESASFSITLWHRIAPFSLNLAELFSTHFIIKEE